LKKIRLQEEIDSECEFVKRPWRQSKRAITVVSIGLLLRRGRREPVACAQRSADKEGSSDRKCREGGGDEGSSSEGEEGGIQCERHSLERISGRVMETGRWDKREYTIEEVILRAKPPARGKGKEDRAKIQSPMLNRRVTPGGRRSLRDT